MKQPALAVILRPKGTAEVRTVIFNRHGPSPNRGGFLFITVMICFLTYASKTKTFIQTRITRRSGTSADKRGVPLGWGSGSGRL